MVSFQRSKFNPSRRAWRPGRVQPFIYSAALEGVQPGPRSSTNHRLSRFGHRQPGMGTEEPTANYEGPVKLRTASRGNRRTWSRPHPARGHRSGMHRTMRRASASAPTHAATHHGPRRRFSNAMADGLGLRDLRQRRYRIQPCRSRHRDDKGDQIWRRRSRRQPSQRLRMHRRLQCPS